MVQIVRLGAKKADAGASTPFAAPIFARPLGLPRSCSDEALCEAVFLHCTGGDDEVVAALLGVPSKALPYWTQSEEWGQIKELLRPHLRGIADTKLTRLINLSLGELEDRLLHGEKVGFERTNNETGKVLPEVRRPLSSKTLVTVLNTLMEKQFLIQRVIDGKDGTNVSPELEKLAETLAAYGKDRREAIEARKLAEKLPEPVVIDVEDTENA